MRHPNRIVAGARLAGLVIAGLFLSGCMDAGRYEYAAIQGEYQDVICAMRPLETGAGKSGSCAVGEPITLADAIAIALKNNPDIRMAAARIKAAEAMIREADAAFYPYLGFYTEYTAADAPSAYLFKTIDQRELPPDANFNDPGTLSNFETGIRTRWNLYRGGQDDLSRRMAGLGRDISTWDAREVENTLVSQVIQAYHDAEAARQFIDIAQESVDTVQKQMDLTQIRYEGGSVLKSDVLSLSVRLAQSREELVMSANRHQTTLNRLARLMGVSPEPQLRLKPAETRNMDLPEDWLAGVAYSEKKRPARSRARDLVRLRRMDLDRARAAWLPAIDLEGRYYLDDENMAYSLDRDNWMVAVVLNYDIFTGFRREARSRQAEAALMEILAADRATDLSVKQEVKDAYLQLEAAKARLDVARSSVDAAQEGLNLVRQQYEGGAATITRYLEAELDLNRARIRAAAAHFDRESALAEIGRAIGYWSQVSGLAEDRSQ